MYEGGEEFVHDPKAWEAAGLEFIDNKDYMERLLNYLKQNVDEEMSKMAPEPVGIVHGDYRIGNVILHPTSFDATSSDLMYNVGPGKMLDTDRYHGVLLSC